MASGDSTAEYRDVTDPAFPGHRVGNDGTIWTRWERVYGGSKLGETWRERALDLTKFGYLVIGFRHRRRFVHRLVLQAFVGPCPPGMECCHNDGDRVNNNLSNLRWDTHKANGIDAVRHGTDPQGERNGRARLTEAEVRAIRNEYAAGGITHKKLAAKYDVTRPAISYIIRRENWFHVD